jgi:hypothetical protein
MNKVTAVTIGITIAIFPTMASAEKLWGHDGWYSLCVPPRGESYLIGVADDGFAELTAPVPGKTSDIIDLYPKIESVNVYYSTLRIIASNSTERAVADFNSNGGSAWRTSPKGDVNSTLGPDAGGDAVACNKAIPADWK